MIFKLTSVGFCCLGDRWFGHLIHELANWLTFKLQTVTHETTEGGCANNDSKKSLIINLDLKLKQEPDTERY